MLLHLCLNSPAWHTSNFRVNAISVVADGGPLSSSGSNLSTADDVIQLFSVQVAIWQVPAFGSSAEVFNEYAFLRSNDANYSLWF